MSDSGKETLAFDFTAADRPIDRRGENPLAQTTTQVPEVVEALEERFGDAVERIPRYAGEDAVFVDKSKIVEVCRFLRDDQAFSYLVDVWAADRFTDTDRFEIIYNLVSIARKKRIRLKVLVDEDEPEVDSVMGVFRSANWNEREAFDMMGVKFVGHEDLRRMYMPEDFEHFPLRKEFPLLGIPGSLPLPPQTPGGPLTMDPFAAAHGKKPVKSYQEPASDEAKR